MTDRKTTIVDEEENLDELLDEVLDDFDANPPSLSSSKSVPATTSSSHAAPGQASSGPDVPEIEMDDEQFTKRLVADVEEMMKDEDKFREQFQSMLNLDDKQAESSSASFADRINETMNKLKVSSEEVDMDIPRAHDASRIARRERLLRTHEHFKAAVDTSDEAMLAEIMSQMEKMADNEDLQNEIGTMLEKFMDQLTSKELLYEPMKELAAQYPKWLDENRAKKVGTEEFAQYERQNEIVQQIVVHFEKPDYNHENEQQNKVVMDLIDEMQKLGQPPEEMLGDFAPQLANLQSFDDKNGGLPPDLIDQCKQM